MSMWEPFTERARRCVVLAQEEAQRFGSLYIGTEHLLLGIVSEGENLACKVLQKFGFTLQKGRYEAELILGRGNHLELGANMQFTPRSKRVVELAFDEARNLNNNYIGTEHLLLGILREGNGIATRILTNQGIIPDTLYQSLHDTITNESKKEKTPTKSSRITISFPRGSVGLKDYKHTLDMVMQAIKQDSNQSQEKNLVLTKLIEAMMWLDKAIEGENVHE